MDNSATTASAVDPMDVRRAIFAGELFLEYLPMVDLQAGDRCIGCEALVRWRRAGAVVPPLAFIPAIENTPVSGLLTYWVIDRMASELGDWLRAHEDVHVAINVPPEILGRGGLEYAAYKANLLKVRSRLLLEITERGAPDHLGLQELRAIAQDDEVLIAMDDIGIDGGSMLAFARTPVDVLKLDRSVIARIGSAGDGVTVEELASLVKVGRQRFVAEGVEHAGQADALRAIGVQWAQGWLYSPPLPAEAFIAWHAAHR
ncbi:EAL domain-containing protein [Thermomonas aquatica]|uniref:EAL domain-containing protein n=1 Tax=Thermomonas aquatica TaxID=2202149 RepID=A0A5B7ZPP4_9GAMM|nr:EAL domain-containing protein [Thermomonas aquatica]QDA57151.1 EAL domain-containing protein [Thermomonas aquatica]